MKLTDSIADPYPTHPTPSQLTMPDFSQAPGGFASGATGSNVKMQLVVVEEYGGFSQVRANDLFAQKFGLKSDVL